MPVSVSCLLLPWHRQHPLAANSLAPFSACYLGARWQDPCSAGGERMSEKGEVTVHPSSVAWLWCGAGKGLAETQTTSQPLSNPRGVCRAHGPTAFSVELCKALAGRASPGLPVGADLSGLCPNHLLLPHKGAGPWGWGLGTFSEAQGQAIEESSGKGCGGAESNLMVNLTVLSLTGR